MKPAVTAFLLLLAVPQDQSPEARRLLDALAPAVKPGSYSQITWENGAKKGSGAFERQKAWRLDTKKGDVEMVFLWDGKGFLNYMKKSNRFFRSPKDSPSILLTEGGPLAEIHYSGSSERLFTGAGKVKVTKEKLDDVDCSHIVIPRTESSGGPDIELHLWVDADKHLRKVTRKSTSQGKTFESTFLYTVVEDVTATAESFKFKVPDDAKDLGK